MNVNDDINRERELIAAVTRNEIAPCYLFIGQRPLTTPLVQRLIKALIGTGSLEFNLETISQESCTSDIVLEAIKTRPFLPGRKIILLQDPPFLAGADANRHEDMGVQDWDTVFSCLLSQTVIRSIMVIESTNVDKRTRAFSTLKRLGPVIYMDLGEKGSKDAKNAAYSYIHSLLKRAGKKAENGTIDLILTQVGDDPVALGIETDKLISLTGSRETITINDVENAVSRQKEEEMFRLSEALLKHDKAGALGIAARLLANDIHPLAIFQTIINFLRKIALVLAALTKIPEYPSMQKVSYSAFQKDILKNLKAFWGEPAPQILKDAHPYGLYLIYKEAHRFRLEKILAMFSTLYKVDLALKGGQCHPRIVLERLILTITDE
ncbi:MAG: DNA polymerase III subunit delta [Dissulfurimicrobium sp.]|uniref:DNA polymerase III subunit delta n=1 Tax=Dissulfurimicrobium sp. TaxID=2022436 RepID=UPI00404A0D81